MARRNQQFGLFAARPEARKRLSQTARTYPVHPIPNAIEISAGGGLFSLAAAIEGVDVQIHCEIDKHAVKTLQANFEGQIIVCDVLQLDPETEAEGLDLFMGGPPCQPWSRAATLGSGRLGPDDPRNLWPEMLRLMESLEPRVVLLENVMGILDKQFTPYLGRPDQGIPGSWWQEAEDAGYEGVIWKLNSADYGTPQNRQRAWMVLWPAGAPWGPKLRKPPLPTHYDPRTPIHLRIGLEPWVSALARFQGGCCQGYGLVTCRNLGNFRGICDGCVNGESFQLAANEEGGARLTPEQAAIVLAERTPGTQRLVSEKPFDVGGIIHSPLQRGDTSVVGSYLAPTVTKHTRKGPTSRVATIEGERMDLACPIDADAAKLRQLTVREAAKVQDVPQWYELHGPLSAQYAQVGNGIAVNMGRAVIRHALQALRPRVASPAPNTLAASQAQTGREGLWPFEDEALCESVRLQPTSRQGSSRDRRRAFPGGDPNRERNQLAAIGAGLVELATQPASVLGWTPYLPGDEVFELDTLAHLLTRYTPAGEYGTPDEDRLVVALRHTDGWSPVSRSLYGPWAVTGWPSTYGYRGDP